MGKRITDIDQQQQSELHAVALSKMKNRCACCVIITCSEPSSDGKMEVEMSFRGEESLAAFLIENAAQAFDDRTPQRESQ